jgi:pilus assembly protein Flp/PilA
VKKMLKFLKEEDGAALIEYVLLAALIAVAAIAAMTAVGDNSQNTLNAAANSMTQAAP